VPESKLGDQTVVTLRIALVNCAFDPDFDDPEALLARYHSLTGWAEALVEAGADAVTVVQRFRRDALVRHGMVDYRFVVDGESPYPAPWFRGRRVAQSVDVLDPTAVDVKGLVFPMLVRQLRWSVGRAVAILVRDHGGFGPHSPSFHTWRGRTFYRFGLRPADGFLFTARDQAAPWLSAGIIHNSNAVHAVPEASTDLDSWPRKSNREERLPGSPSLLWVGRLDANKDPLTVLDGFARATAALPEAALTMVFGDDQLLTDVNSRIAQCPALASRVHLQGRIDRSELPDLYATADVFVLGSHHEVACFSLIEALSFGVTPVVTDIPPFRALTDGGRLGALFSPGNAEELARALERLAGVDFTAQRHMVIAHFRRELSWSAVGRRALEIYRATALRRQNSVPK
jgi:glycosyltransferase involved in cell wall biosynthesis